MRRTLSITFGAERNILRSIKQPYICASCRRSLLQSRSPSIRPQVRYASNISAADPSLREATDFVPASTWDGLDHVGLEPPASDYEFTSFSKEIQPTKLSDPTEIANAVHQAAVEVFTLRAAGKDLDLSREILEHSEETYNAIKHTQLHVTPELGEATLSYPDEAANELIMKELRGDDVEEATDTEPSKADSVIESNAPEARLNPPQSMAPPRQAITSPSPSRPIQSVSPNSFSSISITSLPIKFALIKRITHLTGHRVPDPVLNSLTTLGALYEHLLRATRPKPKKLADRLLIEKDLTGLPNVKISREKQTIIQKEQAVGRLKVINEELKRRGLPAVGERFDE